jgi:hypothetical protein
MQILKPSSVRDATTTWRGIDSRTGNPLRIRRTIDIDGDEHWSLCIQRGGYWQSISKYSGLNRETSQRIKCDFGVVLYDVEDIPSVPRSVAQRDRRDELADYGDPYNYYGDPL